MAGSELALITPRDVDVAVADRRRRVIGIDLGTTNSSVSEIVVEADATSLPEVRMLEVKQPTIQGDYFDTLVPSMVAVVDGAPVVGEGAKLLRPQLQRRGLEERKSLFWDCKNEIGTRRTYHRAPEGYRTPREIATHVLRYLVKAAQDENEQPVDAVVVTTPASFQAAQRKDTLTAARLAGLEVSDHGGLLDEPTAAYIAYMVKEGQRVAAGFDRPVNLLVFDFGGGTCDVALFRLLPPQPGESATIAPLSVSRYCRLGGGDIDRAIVVEALLPQLMDENGLDPGSLDFDDKDRFVIPSLLGLAESLKVGLCKEIVRRQRLGRDLEGLVRTSPGSYPCTLRSGRELLLTSPVLSAERFDGILTAFLDEDILVPHESEYYTACSIFAPLQDGLARVNLHRNDVDLCLAVGGSSLIPHVAKAVERYFPNADLLRYENAEDMQTAVARGAALQALSLDLYGRGIFRAVTGDAIRIRTGRGALTLVEQGVELPFPANGWSENRELEVPRTSVDESVPLRVELCDSTDRTLFAAQWELEPMVSKGDALLLRHRMDENQVFHVEMSLADESERPGFEQEIENPLTNVVNANAKRDRVLELEERMRTGGLSSDAKRSTVVEIADLEVELGRYERALLLLREAGGREPDLWLLNSMAIVCGRMGDDGREEKYYLQAARTDASSFAPLFNLALAKRRRGDDDAALKYVEKALAVSRRPPTFVLLALLEEKRGDLAARDRALEAAFECFEPLPLLDEWELGWYMTGAKLARDQDRIEECEAEQQRRSRTKAGGSETGLLPEVTRGTSLAERT